METEKNRNLKFLIISLLKSVANNLLKEKIIRSNAEQNTQINESFYLAVFF